MASSALGPVGRRLRNREDLVAQEPLGLLDAALQVADSVHLAHVDADVDQRLGNLSRQTGHDDRGAQESRGLHRLNQMVRHTGVHRRDARDVDHDDLGAVDPNAAEQLLRELTRALGVDDADDRKDQQSLAHGQHRSGELTDRFLLLANDSLALLDEAHRHRIGDAVGGGFIDVEYVTELREVYPILGEQRPREHVTQQQHDPNNLVGFNPPRNDALGQAAGVGLQGLDRSGLQGLKVIVVHGRRFGEDLLRRHRGQQLGLGNAPGPLLTELRTVLSEMGYQLAQQDISRSEGDVTERFRSNLNHDAPPPPYPTSVTRK